MGLPRAGFAGRRNGERPRRSLHECGSRLRRSQRGDRRRSPSALLRRAAGRAQPCFQNRAQFRFPVLPCQRRGRRGLPEEGWLQGRDHAGDADGSARGGNGRQVLHREHVPEGVPEHDVHRAQGLVEPHQAQRLRRGQRQGERRQQRRQDDPVPHRLQRGQGQLQVLGPSGVHRADARRSP